MFPVSQKRILFLSLGLILLTACGPAQFTVIPTTSTSSTSAGDVSGNWQFIFVPEARTPVLTDATGSLHKESTTPNGDFTTAVLLMSGPCYADAPLVPTQGFATGGTLTLNSFIVSQQFLTLTTAITNSGAALNGSYVIAGGCGDGARGGVTGTRFRPLTGTYSGPTSAGGTLSLALTQSATPAGDGTFLLVGRMMAKGISCFASGGTSSPAIGGANGSVTGPMAAVAFVTNEAAGSKLSITGTFDVQAKMLTVTRYTVQGGACQGQTGSAVLQVQ